jgi:hypothetical protein
MYKGIKKFLEKFAFCPKILSIFAENDCHFACFKGKIGQKTKDTRLKTQVKEIQNKTYGGD